MNNNPYYIKSDWVGVLGRADERSERDKEMQMMYKPPQAPMPYNRESYMKAGTVRLSEFGPRTQADKDMLMEFDPYITENYCGKKKSGSSILGKIKETFMRRKERYVANNSCGNVDGKSPFASTSDNPNNPYPATFVPIGGY